MADDNNNYEDKKVETSNWIDKRNYLNKMLWTFGKLKTVMELLLM